MLTDSIICYRTNNSLDIVVMNITPGKNDDEKSMHQRALEYMRQLKRQRPHLFINRIANLQIDTAIGNYSYTPSKLSE